jgi:hypothetical protein
MRKLIPLLFPALMLGGCAQQKTALVNHYDDAYFVPSDAAEKPVYSRAAAQNNQASSCDECSYSGSYSDRFRNFGQSGRSHTPGFNPYLGYSPAFGWNYGMNMGFGFYDPWMMNRGMGYNPYMMGGWNTPFHNPWHNPWNNSWFSPWNNPWYWGGGYNPGMGGGGGFGGGGNNRQTTNRLRMSTPNNTLPVYRGPSGGTVNAPQRQTPGNTGSTGRPAPTTSPNAPRNNNTPVQTQPGGNPTSRPTPTTRPTPAPTSRPAPSTQPRPVTPPVMDNNRPPVNNAPAPRNSQPTFSAPPVRSSPSPAPSGGGGGGSSSGPRRR